jgi:hypothetical protein
LSLPALPETPAKAPFERRAVRKGARAQAVRQVLVRRLGYTSVCEARKSALEGCGKQQPEGCVIVNENNDWVGHSQ